MGRPVRKLAHYSLIEPLGTGAMASVWLGRDDNLGMDVAIKILSPKILSDPNNLVRFEQEARAAANLRHLNIAHVFFIGRTEDNLPFYAMEFIDGISLADVIDQRMSFTGGQYLSILVQAARALSCAAEHDILHRDVKPSNIMIARQGGVKLVDFGLAKFFGGDLNITRPGVAVGTPAYLSPELAQGERGDFRADLYSLGITAFEMLAGQPPFRADTPMNVLIKHVQEPLPSLNSFCPRAPRELTRIIERMLAKLPVDRYPTYGALELDLLRLGEQRPDFVAAHFAHCSSCGKLEALDPDGLCLGCYPEGRRAASEELFNVSILGFSDAHAQRRVMEWMLRTTNRPPDVVQRLLNITPVLLAMRQPPDVAKRLLGKLEFMGAHGEMRAVGSRLLHMEDPHKPLEMEPLRELLNVPPVGGQVLREESAAEGSMSAWRRKGRIVLALTVALLVGILISAVVSLWTSENAKLGIPAATHTAPHDISFSLLPLGPIDPWVLEAVATQLRVQASDLSETLHMDAGARSLLILADGLTPFSGRLAAKNVAISHENGFVSLSLQGMQPGDAALPGFLRTHLAYFLLADPARRLPSWLTYGLALTLGEQSGGTHPAPLLVPRIYADATRWEVGFNMYDPGAYAQAHAFVSFLLSHYGLDTILTFCRLLGEGKTQDEASQAAFAHPLATLLDAWKPLP